MPNRSQGSGSFKAMRDVVMRGVAIVATTFINLNKKKGLEFFFILSGNSGNEANILYIGERLIKKSCLLKLSSKCIT
jgi:hypothetical protein